MCRKQTLKCGMFDRASEVSYAYWGYGFGTRLPCSFPESMQLLHSPRFMKGIVKSITCSLSCVIVRSQIARSVLWNNKCCMLTPYRGGQSKSACMLVPEGSPWQSDRRRVRHACCSELVWTRTGSWALPWRSLSSGPWSSRRSGRCPYVLLVRCCASGKARPARGVTVV